MFEKKIDITAAFDKRDPDPSKNYGIHGCEMRFVLTGDKGAVQFVLYTNWQLPHVTEELVEKGITNPRDLKYVLLPMPADLGYHSPKRRYKGQKVLTKSCPYLKGKPCYYDGSGLNAEPVYQVLLEKGSDGVWEELEKYYERIFGEGK